MCFGMRLQVTILLPGGGEMKLKLMALLYFIVFLGLVYHPGCSTADDCTFDITGTWNVTVIWDWDEAEEWPLNLTFTFSGSSTGGTVGGVEYVEGNAGTYTVSDCTTVQVIWDYYNDEPCHVVWIWDGTSISDTSINGTTTLSYTGGVACGGAESGTWTATKI